MEGLHVDLTFRMFRGDVMFHKIHFFFSLIKPKIMDDNSWDFFFYNYFDWIGRGGARHKGVYKGGGRPGYSLSYSWTFCERKKKKKNLILYIISTLFIYFLFYFVSLT